MERCSCLSQRLQWQWAWLFVGADGEVAAQSGDTREGEQLVQMQRLIRCHVGNDNVQEELEVASDAVATDDFVDLGDSVLELGATLRALPGDLDLDEDGEIETELALIEDRPVPPYHAGFLECLEAPQTGRGGDVDAIGERDVR